MSVTVTDDAVADAPVTITHRNLLLTNRLVLLSPYDPSLEFDASHAMERNKMIYALADRQGGTWAGAVEQVRGDTVPVFVRSTGERSERLDALRRLLACTTLTDVEEVMGERLWARREVTELM